VFFELQSCVLACDVEQNNKESWLSNGTVNLAIKSDLHIRKDSASNSSRIRKDPVENNQDNSDGDTNEKHE